MHLAAPNSSSSSLSAPDAAVPAVLAGPPEGSVLLHCQAVGLLTDAFTFAASQQGDMPSGTEIGKVSDSGQMERLCESLLSAKQLAQAMWRLTIASNPGFCHADFAAAQQGPPSAANPK